MPTQMFAHGLLIVLVAASFALASEEDSPDSSGRLESLHELVTAVALAHLPDSYVDDKDWGMTTKRWDGVKISLEGGRLKTKRRWKEVNHGTWKKYELKLVEPEKTLEIHFANERISDDKKLCFDVTVFAHVSGVGRTSQWVKGVQLFSISANADAKVRLRLSCKVGLKLDATKVPPDVLLVPKVTDAKLTLDEFHLDRVSQIHGDASEQLGKALNGVLDDVIEKNEPKLAAKINKQIAKNQDKLRLSLRDIAAAKWQDLIEATEGR